MTQHIGQQILIITNIIAEILGDLQDEEVNLEIAIPAIGNQILRLQGLALAIGATHEDLAELIDREDLQAMYQSFLADVKEGLNLKRNPLEAASRDELLLRLSLPPYTITTAQLAYIAKDLGITQHQFVTDYTDQELMEIYDVITGLEPMVDLPKYLQDVELDAQDTSVAILPSEEDSKEIQGILRNHQ
jgi:hypothetical protein